MIIEITIVLAQTEFAILLNEKERRGLWGLGRPDFASHRIFINEGISGFLLLRRKGIDLRDLWLEGVLQVDGMIIGPGRRKMVSSDFRKY